MKSNIIPLEQNDVSNVKTITLKESAEILGMDYHTARRRIKSEGKIGYFDYDGKISVVEEDVREYKRSHYIAPTRKYQYGNL